MEGNIGDKTTIKTQEKPKTQENLETTTPSTSEDKDKQSVKKINKKPTLSRNSKGQFVKKTDVDTQTQSKIETNNETSQKTEEKTNTIENITVQNDNNIPTIKTITLKEITPFQGKVEGEEITQSQSIIDWFRTLDNDFTLTKITEDIEKINKAKSLIDPNTGNARYILPYIEENSWQRWKNIASRIYSERNTNIRLNLKHLMNQKWMGNETILTFIGKINEIIDDMLEHGPRGSRKQWLFTLAETIILRECETFLPKQTMEKLVGKIDHINKIESFYISPINVCRKTYQKFLTEIIDYFQILPYRIYFNNDILKDKLIN